MNYENKKIKLRKYILLLSRLEKKCQEANTWNSVALINSSSIVNTLKKSNETNAIKETALTINQEIDDLANEVKFLRQELSEAIGGMSTDLYKEIIESLYINGMTIEQLATEKIYSVRHMRRKQNLAIKELEEGSDYFE